MSEILLAVPLFLLGTLIGRTVYVFARHVVDERNPLDPPHCASCSKPFPGIGRLPLHGLGMARKCPSCGHAANRVAPVVDLLFGAYAAAAALLVGSAFGIAAVLVLGIPLLLVALVDLWSRLVLTNVALFAALLGVAFAGLDGWNALGRSFVGCGAALAMFIIFLFTARSLYPATSVVPFGYGDVLLAASIGAILRWPNIIIGLIFGVAIGAVVGIGFVVARKTVGKRSVPYGAFLCTGALLALLLRF